MCTCDGHTLGVIAAALELRVQDSLRSDAVHCSLLQGGDVQHRLLRWHRVDSRLTQTQSERENTGVKRFSALFCAITKLF